MGDLFESNSEAFFGMEGGGGVFFVDFPLVDFSLILKLSDNWLINMHSEIPNGKGHIVARSEDRYCQGTVRVLG